MKILSFETSTKSFSLALSSDEKILACRNFKLNRVLSSSIMPAIRMILKKTDHSFKDIDGLAVGLGPGSFTSLRVGLSTVKGLALASKKPVVGIPSLDILAANTPLHITTPVCVLCDARRSLLYSAFYQSSSTGLRLLGDYSLLGIDALLDKIKEPAFFIGDGIALYREEIIRWFEKKWNKKNFSMDDFFAKEKDWYPRSDRLARLAYPRFVKRDFDSVDKIVPIYLYSEDCQVVKKS